MIENKVVRKPRQKRSTEKKQLILNTAKELFCRNGFHNTTTNEIAKEAELSIGTLYSYFSDKETILLELLAEYSTYFFHAFDFIDEEENIKLFNDDPKKWLHVLIGNLVRLHETQKSFYRELSSLYYTIPAVAAVIDVQDEQIRRGTFELLKSHSENICYNDIEAASIIIADYTSSLIERIVVKENPIGKQRLIDTGIEVLYRMILN